MLSSEQDKLQKVIEAMRPKSVFWLAPLFKQGGIHLSYDEANLLFLSSVAQGAKGVRCHLWDFVGDDDNGGLSKIDELQKSVKLWSKIRNQYELGSLLPYGKFDYENIHVWVAINLRKGLFVVWKRNDFSQYAQSDGIQISMPKHFTFSKVIDVISEKRFFVKEKFQNNPLISLPTDATYGAMWISCNVKQDERKIQ